MKDVREAKGLPATLPLLEEAPLDRRNLIPVCRRHHELVTNHRIRVTRAMLPVDIDAFAEETGTGWYLARYFDREAA